MNIIIIIFNITSCIWNWSHTNHLHERDQTQQCGNHSIRFNRTPTCRWSVMAGSQASLTL